MKVNVKELLSKDFIKDYATPVEGADYEIEFAHYFIGGIFTGGIKDVHNTLVLFSPKHIYALKIPYDYGFKNCLILLNSRFMIPNIEGDTNSYVILNYPLQAFDSIVKEYRLDPYEVDENCLKFRRDYKNLVFIDRATYIEEPKVGMFTQIGKTGDVFDGVGKEVLSIGAVKIEDNVTIGNNVTIYRGLTGYTVIKSGTRISDNCVIHHDAVVSGVIKSFTELYE